MLTTMFDINSLKNILSLLFLGFNGILAAVFFFLDEPFHRERGLDRWEKISHPIDSASVGLTFGLGYLACKLQSPGLFYAYCFSALVTILLSFKDEFVHKEVCKAEENIVHALMFSLNGIIFCLGAFLILLKTDAWPFLLGLSCAILTAFWQIIFWFLLFTKPSSTSPKG